MKKTLIALLIFIPSLTQAMFIDLNEGFKKVAALGHWQHIAELVDLGINPNILHQDSDDKNYKAPIISIIANHFQEGYSCDTWDGYCSQTHLPLFTSHLRCIIELCKRKTAVNLNLQDTNGNTALHNFIEKGIEKGLQKNLMRSISYLIIAKASLTITNNKQKTAINRAREYLEKIIMENKQNKKIPTSEKKDEINQWTTLVQHMELSSQKKETALIIS